MKKKYIAILALTMCFICSCGSVKNQKIKELTDFPESADPLKVGLKVSERFLSRPHSSTGSWYTEEERAKGGLFNFPVGYIVYPDVCAWYGALLYSEVTSNKGLFDKLVQRAAPIVYGDEMNLIPVANHVDNNIFGVVPLEIYSVNRDERFLKLGKYMADEQFKTLDPTEYAQLDSVSEKWYDSGLSWNSRMWIDDMYMLPILQIEAYKATGDTIYIERAGKEMAAYLKELQKENGLFHHADNVPIYWGRGNGWVAAGMAEVLDKLPENSIYFEPIMNGYLKMMETLLKYQSENGMWNQIVDDPKAWPETSCTGMFAFSFIKGVKKGWLKSEKYALPARKSWVALCEYIDENGDVTDICIGTNKKNDYQYYLDRAKMTGDLHGQAPVLWCAAELLK